MDHKLFRNSFLFAVLLFALTELHAADTPQPPKEKKAARPLFSVIQKDGKKVRRRCFKDNDKNGYCDNGSEQKWKCKNNCRLDVSAEKKSEKNPEEPQKKIDRKEDEAARKVTSLCSCCPLAGNCSKGCFALI